MTDQVIGSTIFLFIALMKGQHNVQASRTDADVRERRH